MTPDPAAASDFYAKLLGWSYEKMDMATGPYTVAKVGEWPVAGIMAPPDEGVPTVWSTYVTVDDVNLIASKAVELGGKIELSPIDVPGVGRLCGIQDPQGAVIFAVQYEAKGEHANSDPFDFQSASTTHGMFSWFELRTSDVDAAREFYSQLFGWSIVTEEMQMGPYSIVKVGEVGMGGMVASPWEDVPPHWGGYLTVDDTDAAVARATELGGTVLMPPFDIPNVGRFSALKDPQGAVLAVIAYVSIPAESG